MERLITWNNQYSVGIEHLDDEHKQLVELLNSLHYAMSQGQANSVLGKILDELIHYTATHFKSEEVLFAQHEYPDSEKHIAEHQELVSEVLTFKKEFDKGTTMLSIKIIGFLKNWLIKHILASDKEYSEFLNSKGIY